MALLRNLGRGNTLHELLNLLDSYDPTLGYSPSTGKYVQTISSWTADGTKFFADVSHNLNNEDILYTTRYTDTSEFIQPQKMKILNPNTLRVWFMGNGRNVKIVVSV